MKKKKAKSKFLQTKESRRQLFIYVLIVLAAGSIVFLWQQNTIKKIYQKEHSLSLLHDSEVNKLQTRLLKYEQGENVVQECEDDQNTYELLQNECSSEECLFNYINVNSDEPNNYLLGLSLIKGYYSPVEREAWGQTNLCDSFTVIDGPTDIITAWINLVNDGNTIHSLNDAGQPVINLDMDQLSQFEKQKITSSTQNNLVELYGVSPSPPNRGVSACFGDIEVIKVK